MGRCFVVECKWSKWSIKGQRNIQLIQVYSQPPNLNVIACLDGADVFVL